MTEKREQTEKGREGDASSLLFLFFSFLYISLLPCSGPPLVDRPSGSSLLLHQIQQGTQLRKAPPAGELPDLKALNKDEAKTLESTLAAAMQARRAVIQTPDDDEDDGGAWSD